MAVVGGGGGAVDRGKVSDWIDKRQQRREETDGMKETGKDKLGMEDRWVEGCVWAWISYWWGCCCCALFPWRGHDGYLYGY